DRCCSLRFMESISMLFSMDSSQTARERSLINGSERLTWELHGLLLLPASIIASKSRILDSIALQNSHENIFSHRFRKSPQESGAFVRSTPRKLRGRPSARGTS